MNVTTQADFDRVLDEIECFPAWRDDAWTLSYDAERQLLVIEHLTFDTRDDEVWREGGSPMPAPLRSEHPLKPSYETEDDLVRDIVQAVAQLAAHEAMEWTRHRGRIAIDPHVDGEPLVRL